MSIQLNIDVTKLKKEWFKHVTRSSGDKAVFTDLRLIEHKQEDNDGMVVQVIPKAFRQDRLKNPIIGNYKVFADNYGQEAMPKDHTPKQQAPLEEEDDIPF